MPESIISFVLLTAIVLAAIFITLNVGVPVIESAKTAETARQTEAIMIKIDNAVREVVKEGLGSKRVIKFMSPGDIEIIPEEEAIQSRTEVTTAVIDYLSRKTGKNILYIGGEDVVCDNSTNLTMENSFFKITLNKITNATPLSTLNTRDNIISITEKESGTQINVSNSTIIIDSNATFASGSGYSELLLGGVGLPSCTAHFFVNVTNANSYDVYYTLYAGADFVKVEVRNVK